MWNFLKDRIFKITFLFSWTGFKNKEKEPGYWEGE